jgi:PAS domain S-box-containing protein
MRTAPYSSVTTPDVNIGIVTALLDEQGEVYGVVGMDVTLANLTNYIEGVQVGRDGWVILTDKEGTILASRDKELRLKNIKDMGLQGLDTILDKKEGFSTFTRGSEERYVYFYESPELGWKLAFVMPLEEIDNEISGFVNRIVLILILSLLLLSIITLLGLQKFVITPLKKLEDHTKLIKRTGDLDQQIELRSGDELEFLASSCNEMVASIKETNQALRKSEEELKKHRDRLEDLVEERTSELKTINEELKEEIFLRERTEKDLKVNEERLKALLEINKMKSASEQELISFTLEESIRQTQSRVGYLHFYNEGAKTLDLNLWSKEVLKECKAEKTPHYPLDEAGVWADCIRLRQAVIHNDYQNMHGKKGYPEDHFPVIRHMSVPVFDSDKIVAILGVGNKEDEYDESDARQVSLFMNAMWEILQRKRAEEDLHKGTGWAAGLQKAGQELAGCRNIQELAKIAAFAPVKNLGLRMAWISTPAENGNAVPLVCSEPGYEHILAESKCPGDVLKNREAIIVPDVMDNPPYPECPSIALKGEFKSCATLPIMVEDECIATLSVRSPDKGSRAALIQALPLIEVFCRHVGYVWQRLLAEERLNKAFHETEEARDQIDGILKSVGDGLIVMDINNRVVLMNKGAEDLLHVRFSETVNRPIQFAIHDKSMKEKLTKTLEKNKLDYQFDFEIPGQDPEHTRIMRARTSGIIDRHGKHAGTVTIIRDVTQEREVDRMKTEFLSTAAHEIRTPLTSIQGFSEILMSRDNIKKKDRSKFLRYIHDQSVHLTNIINDLLDISRIESGVGFSLNRISCNIGEIIKDVVSRFEAPSPKHRFDIILSDASIQIKADKEKLEQILWNLLSNSVKYSPDGGSIAVRGELRGKDYEISVEDEGVGMTPEQLERIFDKFYRADPGNNEIPGTGLGMNIVKYLVEAHRGEIRFESEVGKGTSVIFTIPNL